MQRFTTLLFVFALAWLASGCSTLADAQAARGQGNFRVYEKPYDVVWGAVVETVRASGLTLVSDNKDKGTILAHRSGSFVSWGENVAIFVEDVGGQTKTRVEVVNKRVLSVNVTAAAWEYEILAALDKRL
jgi:hypothetical protein